MKKIDAHLHLAKVLAGYCRRGELRAVGGGRARWGNGEEFQLLPTTGEYGDENFTAEQALAIMDRNEVEKAVLMNGSMYGFQNIYHEELLEKYPDRFCPSCEVDPFATNHMSALTRFLEEKHFHLVKFEVSSGGGLMGCHDPFDLSGERMMEIYKLIEKHKGVVALDVGDIDMESHQTTALLRLADRCPDLKVVICHLLAPMREKKKEWKAELTMLAQANIWFDIAAMPKIMAPDVYPYPETVEYLREAADIVGVKKLMWGTDAPFAATQDTYEHLADYLEKTNAFTPEELADVYFNNAKEVYFPG
ncbi:MAG: amidohydrolase [Lachnospiraceae bacterium]|nr:amidohydrolase [Lachnospiraceae bacterium]